MKRINLIASITVLMFALSVETKSQTTETPKPQTTGLANADSLHPWKTGGFASFTFNQLTLSNWTAGGENALSGTGILNLFANYRKEKIEFDNALDLGYGLTKSQNLNIRKNEDKIDLNSKLGYRAFDKVFYTVMFNYRTQFDEGFKYPNDTVVVSKFNAPGFFALSVGVDYKPTNYFSVFISPASGKLTIVADQALADAGAFGVDPAVYENGVKVKNGKKNRAEFGAILNAKLQKDIGKNVNLVSKLGLFNGYTDKDVNNRKNIDVNFETMLNIKAGKYLTTTILVNFIYDQNLLAKNQFKQMLGVGASYKF